MEMRKFRYKGRDPKNLRKVGKYRRKIKYIS